MTILMTIVFDLLQDDKGGLRGSLQRIEIDSDGWVRVLTNWMFNSIETAEVLSTISEVNEKKLY